MRLDKLLVERGFGSRKDAQRLVRRGLVDLGDDTLRDPRHDVPDGAILRVDGEDSAPLPVLVAWHKPVGILSTVRDPWGREGLDGVLPEPWQGAFHPVGRLDKDTSGLLLFSREGALTQRILHPKRAVPRTYVATVERIPGDLPARLAAGVQTAEGTFTGVVEVLSEARVRITVTEGKHRMVRRMLANASAPVTGLHRVAYGPVGLGELPVGEWVPVEPGIVDALRR